MRKFNATKNFKMMDIKENYQNSSIKSTGANYAAYLQVWDGEMNKNKHVVTDYTSPNK